MRHSVNASRAQDFNFADDVGFRSDDDDEIPGLDSCTSSDFEEDTEP